jgi:hypothetical protein
VRQKMATRLSDQDEGTFESSDCFNHVPCARETELKLGFNASGFEQVV